MTVRRSDSSDPSDSSEPPADMISLRTLLLLIIAGFCTWVAVQNPVWGAAILVGVGVLALLHMITRNG